MLTRIKVDDAALELLADQGYKLDDVPPAGEMVKLTLTGNMSTGGISIDRTFEAHPENVEIAEEAARVVGLDIAGIDFICPDITEPVRETGGAICEVNAAPGFRMHTHPTIGDPQFISKPVVDMLFPPGAPSRIPIVAVTGTNGKTTTSRMISHIFKGMGRKVGMTSTDGVVIDERLVIRADASGPKSARMVLQNPRVDFAVFEVARGGILREGLGYERNDVAVVLNVQPDHLGLRGIDTVEQLADVKAVLVEAVPRDGSRRTQRRRPAGARDAAPLLGSGRLVLHGRARLRGARHDRRALPPGRQGGRARAQRPRRDDRGQARPPRDAAGLDPPAAGDVRRQGPDERAERARRRGRRLRCGAPLHDIRQGLRTFSTNYYLSPGRLNEIEVNGVHVIVDYCHNAPGMRMLGDFVDRVGESLCEHQRARPSRPASASSPPQETAATRTCSSSARSPPSTSTSSSSARTRPAWPRARRRPPGWSPRASRRRSADGARCKQVEIVLDEIEAVRHAMARANNGDLVVVCVDKHPAVMAELENWSNQAQAAPVRPTTAPSATPTCDPRRLPQVAASDA